MTDARAPRRRAPLLFSALVAGTAALVVPVMSTDLGPSVGFLPMVLALVAVFDLVSAYLLLQQVRNDGDTRSLAMAVAYTCSLVVMLGYAGAFPGVVSDPAPLASAPSVAPWMYVLWHSGFPVLLGLAWAPWPARWKQTLRAEARRRASVVSQVAAVVVGLAVVAAVVIAGTSLPVLIVGRDTSRMTQLTAPFTLPLVALAVLSTAWALRRRQGPERWTAVAVWVCLVDLSLTYASSARFSAGWYTGRALTVIAAAVVLVAMLHETSRLKALLHRTLARERASQLLQASLLDSLEVGVVLTDLDGRILSMNRSMQARFSEVGVGEVPRPIAMTTPDGVPIPWSQRPAATTAATGQGLTDVLLVLSRPDGDDVWLSASTTPVLDGDGQRSGVVTVYTDVTFREQARRALEQTALELAVARDAAVAADRAKSSFFAATSHEIRTPLNGVLGMTGLLRATDLDERQREFVDTARACGEQLLGLLDDVLDFSKAEGGHLQLDHRPLDLRRLVDDVLDMVGATARAKGLHVSGVVHDDLPAHVLGDALRLRQCLLNLLSNAVKFTTAGTVLLRVEPQADRVLFAVDDTGIGVDPAVVPMLFEPFRQADAGTTRRHGGTGLGLAITREIALLHGGTTGATPRAPAGSTFWFTAALPATAGPADVPEQPRDAHALRGHVLLAEDNVVNQRISTLLLEGLGLRVTVVGDGRQAVEAAVDGTYDVVLMDCQMPVLDGLEATVELRARGCRTPVLALTAGASRQDELACLAAGMDGYVTKPVEPVELGRILARHLAPSGSPAATVGS